MAVTSNNFSLRIQLDSPIRRAGFRADTRYVYLVIMYRTKYLYHPYRTYLFGPTILRMDYYRCPPSLVP